MNGDWEWEGGAMHPTKPCGKCGKMVPWYLIDMNGHCANCRPGYPAPGPIPPTTAPKDAYQELLSAHKSLQTRYARLLAAAELWKIARQVLYDTNACPEDPTDPFPESDVLAKLVEDELLLSRNLL